MPRQPRAEFETGITHVFARGNNRRRIFFEDEDRARYLRMLGAVVRHRRWRCLSYCLMDNHVHLLIETTTPNLGAGIQRLHGPYAQDLNRRRGTTGHLFESRYGAVRVRTDPQLWAVVGYIARNPVEAKCCKRPEDWRWSAHSAMARGAEPEWLDAQRLFALLGVWNGDGELVYRHCVAANLRGLSP